MSISKKSICVMLERFAVIFPRPTNANADELSEIWHSAIGNYSEEVIFESSRRLLKSLKRFPYPADFHEDISEYEASLSNEFAI